MAHFPKPAEGSWTEHYPHARHRTVSYARLDLARVLRARARGRSSRKTWLNVGRVEQLTKVGSYFTKELDAAGTSIIVVAVVAPTRSTPSTTSVATAATSSCGTTSPSEETSGVCRQFTCKYHGWRYALDGELTFVQQESEFFDLDKADYPLASVQCDVWEGFIFVNLDPDEHHVAAATTWARSAPGSRAIRSTR